jgi:hypothetical protein
MSGKAQIQKFTPQPDGTIAVTVDKERSETIDLLAETKTQDWASTIIIPRRHQSAPKEHWADAELRKAAEEIDKGQFLVPQDDNEFFNYGPTQFLARHPRVQEALQKLEREKEESNSQEALEKAQMIFEINENMQKVDQWDNQGRWIGKENEEARIGQVLSPFAFMEKLRRAGVSESRVQMNSFAVNKRAALLAWEIDWATGKRKQVQVATLQYPLGSEWLIMRFSEYGVPTTARYLGWRTALLSMISLGVITETEAHKAFPLGSGSAGDWYRQQLQQLKSQKIEHGKYAN